MNKTVLRVFIISPLFSFLSLFTMNRNSPKLLRPDAPHSLSVEGREFKSNARHFVEKLPYHHVLATILSIYNKANIHKEDSELVHNVIPFLLQKKENLELTISTLEKEIAVRINNGNTKELPAAQIINNKRTTIMTLLETDMAIRLCQIIECKEQQLTLQINAHE